MDEMEQRVRRQTLIEVIGREKLPQEPVTNQETLAAQRDPTLARMLAEIAADIAARDALIPDYRKADEAAKRASSKSHGLWNDIRRLDDRVAKTREAFEVLKTRASSSRY